jgi:hypothetical protein
MALHGINRFSECFILLESILTSICNISINCTVYSILLGVTQSVRIRTTCFDTEFTHT